MNCFYHPSTPAVASCIDCGKGLCHSCASVYTQPICKECNDKRKGSEIAKCVKPLVICPILYIIGANLEILGPDPYMGGYMFMSIYAGWKFIDQFLPNIFIWFNLQAILYYYVVRIFLSMFIGALTTPFYLIWCLIKLIRSIVK